MTAPHAFDLGDLKLGVATAATQIEGGALASSWHDWARVPGHIADGSTPERTTEHWQRWREDTALLSELGIGNYRMSVEWARLEPRPGEFDLEALEHYRAELQALLDAGVRPLVTLHHFTNPSWFEAIGGWTHVTAVPTFLRFVEHVVRHLADLVTDWCTINEPNVYATGGYLFGEFPPGRTQAWADVRAVLRHMAAAHCAAYHLIHDIQPDAKVGFAHHLRVFDPLDPGNRLHRLAARTSALLFQEELGDAMLGGRFGRLLGGQPSSVTPGAHYDYLGVNYYSRSAVSRLADGTRPDAPVNDLGWEVHPAGLIAVCAELHRRHPGPIWVTENGTADASDAFRSRFIHEHLAAIAASSLPFRRYHHWCFVDNWEWEQGDAARFGLVHLDHETQERTVKGSGRFYADVIRERGCTEELYAARVAGQTYPRSTGAQ